MTQELLKQYDPRAAQRRWYPFWESHGYFHSEPDPTAPPYCIVIPPPNVTGALHMGHALNNTLQDILIRWKRMQGYQALWVPGTDHAGIATQAVVERRLLEEEGKTRHDLGREALVQRIWAWKDAYEARILRQLKEMGCSCDWQRTRFTLDPVCARAVRESFFALFREGLIYRGKRLVNWDAHLQTAVADDEIFHETVQGSLWTFRYPIKDEDAHILIATTRPETMLGDTAVAVHPEDERYRHLIGKTVLLPLVRREIPIIADGVLVDPKFGTGAVKVTPAHDPNDYQCALRHGLPMINILNSDGSINESGGPYRGLDRSEARRRVVEDLTAQGLIEKVEPYETDVGHSDRSKTPIEPYLSDQWFVRMGDLAQQAMNAVTDGRIAVYPPRYAKTYLDWLGEKRDWCISRQLWWGHRIAVWSRGQERGGAWSPAEAKGTLGMLQRLCEEHRDKVSVKFFETGVVTAASEAPQGWPAEVRPTDVFVCIGPDADDLGERLEDLGFEQDPDVLDTWFSSALWPHSTLGWPEKAPELDYYYPTDVLVTAREIITLWVARMVMLGLHNMGRIPFRHVYIHPVIQDGEGRPMKKTLGNGVDPLDVIDKYGCDALRFTLAQMTTEQQDVRMPVAYDCPHCGTLLPQKREHQELRVVAGKKPRLKCPACKKDFQPSSPKFDADPGEPVGRLVSDRFELGRNFANKLWNAARFAILNLEGYQPGPIEAQQLALEDRWILSRLHSALRTEHSALSTYRFSDAARTLYDFTWGDFCDWYLEILKPRLQSAAARPVAQRMLAGVLDVLLRLLHPIMPFVTEEIWQRLGEIAPVRNLPAWDGEAPAEPVASSVMIAPWPALAADWKSEQVEAQMAQLQEIVTTVRNIRASFQVPPSATVDLYLRCADGQADSWMSMTGYFENLAKAHLGASHVGPNVTRPADSASFSLAELEGYIPLAGLIDLDAERIRLRKQLEKLDSRIAAAEKKLADTRFLERAPADVVQQQRDALAELQGQRAGITALLEQLQQG